METVYNAWYITIERVFAQCYGARNSVLFPDQTVITPILIVCSAYPYI
jgi:hypothetical protein